MTRIVPVSVAFGCAVLVAAVLAQQGQTTPEQPVPPPGEMAEMLARMQKATSPGQAHQRLNALAGSWKTVDRIWMGGPDSTPIECPGTAQVRWVLDGRFLLEEKQYSLPLPAPDGGVREVNVSGLGLLGYENFRNQYVATWCDSVNTHLVVLRGQFDPAGRKLTLYGEMDEPTSHVVGRMIKLVTRIVSKDKLVTEIYDLHAGEDSKLVEITYERQ